MKRIPFSVIMTFLLVTSVSVAANPLWPEGLSLATENDFLALLINTDTTDIAVFDKAAGAFWYSNPPNRHFEETLALGIAKELLNAHFIISYYQGSRLMTMNTCQDSVLLDQFSVEMIDSGVRVTYMLGKRWENVDYVPMMISEKRLESFMDKLSPENADFVRSNYTLITLSPIEKDYEPINVFNLDTQQLFGDFFINTPDKQLTTRATSDLISLLADRLVENRYDLGGRKDLQSEDFVQLQNNRVYMLNDKIRAWYMDDIIALFQQAGYQPEDKALDHSENHMDPPVPNIFTFVLPVEYLLEQDSFVVKISMDDVVFPENVLANILDESSKKITVPIVSINALPYFGAAGTTDEGYIFVPDGSGALINFNSGNLGASPYSQSVYGLDRALAPRNEQSVTVEQIHLPVFGMKQDTSAFLAVLESGDPLATIKADISGRMNSYNTVSAEFNLRPRAETSLRGSPAGFPWLTTTSIPIAQVRSALDDIQIRYLFLAANHANYVGMAHGYQDYLVKKHNMQRLADKGCQPLIVELIGAISTVRSVWGISRRITQPVTTYEQALMIVEELNDKGVSDLILRYNGWLKGGISHVYPNKAYLEPKLGSANDFQRLVHHVNDLGFSIYPEVSFLNVYQDGLFDGFSASRDASRFLNRNIASVYDYDMATFLRGSQLAYILSPIRLGPLIDGFLESYKQYENGAISVSNMGVQLNGDYREDKEMLIDRNQAKGILIANLQSIKSEGLDIMADGGNAYALPFCNVIVNMPLGSSQFNLIDQTVPFLALVMHGYLDYAGTPLNLAGDYQDALLQTVEAGASLYFEWFFDQASVAKDSGYHNLYSVGYHDWVDKAIISYHTLNELIGNLRNQKIINHEQLAGGVYSTTYEDYTMVLVNYNLQPVTHEGIVIPPKDFRVFKGGTDL